jgi:hypothetical protein
MGHQIVLRIGDSTVEALLLAVDPRQDEGRGQEFDGAAQGKELFAPIGDRLRCGRVEDGNAQAPAMPALEIGELLLQLRPLVPGGCGMDRQGRQGKQRAGQKTAA